MNILCFVFRSVPLIVLSVAQVTMNVLSFDNTTADIASKASELV